MMRIATITFISSLLCMISCRQPDRDVYAIRDFDKAVRADLSHLVSIGIAGTGDSICRHIKKTFSDPELSKLSLSEHPLLRALALEEMIVRPSFKYTDVIKNHLSDTALIQVDRGEFGIYPMFVADYIIYEVRFWKDSADRTMIVDEVLQKHTNLSSAYLALRSLPIKEKYYNSIQSMALAKRPFEEIEIALNALAKYKKQEDRAFIKKIMQQNIGSLGATSFYLIINYPDTGYQEILEEYAPRIFKNSAFSSQYLYFDAIFRAIASYKNKRSADILRKIRIKIDKLGNGCFDVNRIKSDFFNSIWDNQCAAFTDLIEEGKPFILEEQKNKIPGLPLEQDDSPWPILW